MKTYRKLHRKGLKEGTCSHFTYIVGEIRRILGSPSAPSAAQTFNSQDDFARAYLSYSLTRKAVKLDLMSSSEREALMNVDPEVKGYMVGQTTLQQAQARVAFMSREAQNRLINNTATWGWCWRTERFISDDSIGHNVLLRAREIFQEILGEFDIDEVIRHSGFGNGASSSLKRSEAQREKKYLTGLTGSDGILPLATLVVSGSPVWSDIVSPKDTIYVHPSGKTFIRPDLLKKSSGAVLDFVRKDAGTDRIIIKEAELNGYIQRGIGSVIRKRLRRYKGGTPDGVNLNTSGALNSSLAQAGSKHGHIGTVDGKQASDSITLSLVEFMASERWFKLLRVARSDTVVTPWGTQRIQMIGGMGNGFVFELESAIFYAIGLAAAERSSYPNPSLYVSIHGDDLTIPSDVLLAVEAAYTYAGIQVNRDKTFVTGPFRESCGGHFFGGDSVKPFYIKKQTGALRGDWMWLANSLLTWLSERTEDFILSHRGRDLSEVLLYLRWYASSGEPRKWSVGVERSRRSGLYALQPYKYRKGWPLARIVVEITEPEKLPDEGCYLAALQEPTRPLSVLDLCMHKSATSSEYVSTIEGDERDRWKRLTTFTPFHSPTTVAPLWQLCRDHNLLDF